MRIANPTRTDSHTAQASASIAGGGNRAATATANAAERRPRTRVIGTATSGSMAPSIYAGAEDQVVEPNAASAIGLGIESWPKHATVDTGESAANDGAIVSSKSASHNAVSVGANDKSDTNGTGMPMTPHCGSGSEAIDERHSARCSSACVRTQPRHARRLAEGAVAS